MKNVTISFRLAVAAGFLCCVVAALTVFAALRFASLRAISAVIQADSVPGMIASAQIHDWQAEAQLRTLRLLLTASPEGRAQIRRELAELTQNVAGALARYERTIRQPEDRALFDTLTASRTEFLRRRAHYLELVDSDRDAAVAYSAGELRDAYGAYSRAGDVLFNLNARAAAERGKELADEVATNIRLVTIVGAAAIVIGLFIIVAVVKQLNGVLRRMSRSLEDGAANVAAAAGQVAGSSKSLAAGASEQAASLEETSSAIEEVASMSKRNAESATQARARSQAARTAADTAAAKVTGMERAMDSIKASSDEMANIIKTIDEIAFQTNILALNAAVEAARAGFAVVADEVRNLAQRAAGAAKETAVKIEESLQRSAAGVALSQDVAAALGEILEQTRGVDALVAEIDAASNEQTRGLQEVSAAVTRMNAITQSNAGGAQDSAASADQLTAEAVAQQRVVHALRRLVEGASAEAQRATNATPPLAPAAATVARRTTRNLSGARPALRRPDADVVAGPADGLTMDAASLARAAGTPANRFRRS